MGDGPGVASHQTEIPTHYGAPFTPIGLDGKTPPNMGKFPNSWNKMPRPAGPGYTQPNNMRSCYDKGHMMGPDGRCWRIPDKTGTFPGPTPYQKEITASKGTEAKDTDKLPVQQEPRAAAFAYGTGVWPQGGGAHMDPHGMFSPYNPGMMGRGMHMPETLAKGSKPPAGGAMGGGMMGGMMGGAMGGVAGGMMGGMMGGAGMGGMAGMAGGARMGGMAGGMMGGAGMAGGLAGGMAVTSPMANNLMVPRTIASVPSAYGFGPGRNYSANSGIWQVPTWHVPTTQAPYRYMRFGGPMYQYPKSRAAIQAAADLAWHKEQRSAYRKFCVQLEDVSILTWAYLMQGWATAGW